MYFLWQLFHIRTDVEEKENALNELNGELEESNGFVEEVVQMVRGTKKEASASKIVSSKLKNMGVDMNELARGMQML